MLKAEQNHLCGHFSCAATGAPGYAYSMWIRTVPTMYCKRYSCRQDCTHATYRTSRDFRDFRSCGAAAVSQSFWVDKRRQKCRRLRLWNVLALLILLRITRVMKPICRFHISFELLSIISVLFPSCVTTIFIVLKHYLWEKWRGGGRTKVVWCGEYSFGGLLGRDHPFVLWGPAGMGACKFW